MNLEMLGSRFRIDSLVSLLYRGRLISRFRMIWELLKRFHIQIGPKIQAQMEAMRTQMAAAAEKAKTGGSATGSTTSKKRPAVKGIAFKVQIGAFQNKDLSKYLDKSDSFFGEVGEDGLMRYTLGVFTDYWEADTFKKYMREMGVSDAWIISYRDGVRVPIKEVLENIPKS